MVGVPTFPYGPTSFDGGGVSAAGVSAAYRVDLSKKIPQLGEIISSTGYFQSARALQQWVCRSC